MGVSDWSIAEDQRPGSGTIQSVKGLERTWILPVHSLGCVVMITRHAGDALTVALMKIWKPTPG